MVPISEENKEKHDTLQEENKECWYHASYSSLSPPREKRGGGREGKNAVDRTGHLFGSDESAGGEQNKREGIKPVHGGKERTRSRHYEFSYKPPQATTPPISPRSFPTHRAHIP